MKKAFLTLIATAALAASTQAAVITVTDGDAGGGLTLNPSDVIYAVNFNGGSETVQGVAFTNSNANVSVVTNVPGSIGAPSLGASANDVALSNIYSSVWYTTYGTPANSMQCTISGLTTGVSYKVELLVLLAGTNRFFDLYFNGSGISSDYISSASSVGPYNVQNTVTAVGGAINFSVETPAGGQTYPYPIMSGLVVSAVPEPATWALLAGSLTVVMILRRRRA